MKSLSPYLQKSVDQGILSEDVAEIINRLPDWKQQQTAVRKWRERLDDPAKEIVAELEKKNRGENPSLKGVLPKIYGRPDLDKQRLGELIDLIGTIGLGDKESRSKDIPASAKSAKLEEITSHSYVLTPGRFVGAEEIEDDGEPFEEKMKRLTGQLEGQFAEGRRLEEVIRQNLATIKK